MHGLFDSRAARCDNVCMGQHHINRRDFLKTTTTLAAATAMAGLSIPHVFAAEDNTIQLAVIGVGGRGAGAVHNALATKSGPVKLVAMADVFEERNKTHYEGLKKARPEQVDVTPERMFVGFDAYRKAMDCLKAGDVVILTTPPAFRPLHLAYAIEKGLHVFMEKPVTVDGPSTRKLLELSKAASAKNLKVGVGLMCRHCEGRRELKKRIEDGAIGDIIAMRAYRMHGPVAECFVPKNPGAMSDVLYQVRNFHAFLWASGGLFSDFNIHNIDECCWMKGAWPVKAQASGGRLYRGDNIDQNFDTYDVEYTFADGSKFFFMGRCIDGCEGLFASYAHGSKGIAQISANGHSPAKPRYWKGQDMSATPVWKFGQEPSPYQLEWDHLMEAIRKDTPFNEAERGAQASLVTSMGRMAAHTGQAITYEQILNCEHDFAPGIDKLTLDGPPPLVPDKDGKVPVPQPGIKKDREY